jgi:predicted CoA-binding protein
MASDFDLNVFLNPKSVAVIGATERPGSWGSFIMGGLLSRNFAGAVYPVNRRAEKIFGIPAVKNPSLPFPNNMLKTKLKPAVKNRSRALR